MFCSNCGTNIKNKLNCQKCGFPIKKGNTYCFYCGYKKPYINIAVCPKCYTHFKEEKKFDFVPPKKYRLLAGFLQILFGLFGMGRFYMHSYKIALSQCFVSLITLGIGGIWGFIDGLLILNGKVKKDGYGNELVNY